MRKNLKFILLVLIALGILWFFGRSLDWEQVITSLRQANAGYLIAAAAIVCSGYLLRAKRWQVLLEPITPSSLRELFATTTVGFSALFLVGRAGEIIRPMWLPMRDRRVRPSAALVTIGVERIFDLAALICFFSVNLLWLEAPAGRESEFQYVKTLGVLMLVGVVFGFIALYIYQRISAKIISWFEEKSFVQNKIGKIFLSILRQLANSLQILKDWREIASVVFWTIALWLSISLPTWFVLLAFDLPMNFSHALFIMGWSAIGSLVPTPGGAAGAFHTVTANGLMFLGVDRNKAAAVSILMHLVYFAPALIFGIYYFVRGDISISRFKNLLTSENAVEEIESDSPDFQTKTDETRKSKNTGLQTSESKSV